MKSLKFLLLLALGTALYGQSPIEFMPDTTIVTGSGALVITINDFNNDGLEDVVIGTSFKFDPPNDFKIKLFLQNSQGGLDPQINYPYSNSNEYIAAISSGDLNGDGLADVIVGAGDKVKVLYQNANGGFDPFQEWSSGNRVDGVAIGDLNNDGLPDMVAAHYHENFIKLFLQNATGFSTITYPKPQSGLNELKVADINHDGLDDVIYMEGERDGAIHVYLQNANGTLNAALPYRSMITDYNSLSSFDIADINNDGKLDMVASIGSHHFSSRMLIWDQQNSSSNMILPTPYTVDAFTSPQPVNITDLNCDNKMELLSMSGGGVLNLFESDSLYQFSNYTFYDLPYVTHFTANGMAVGDLNNDGKTDVASADFNNGLIIMYNATQHSEEHFLQIDTTVVYDTTLLSIRDSSSWLVKDSSWTANGYQYYQKDSTVFYHFIQTDSISRTTSIKKSGSFCQRPISDSSRSQSHLIERSLRSSNGSLLSRRLDSVNAYSDIKLLPNPNRGQFVIQVSAPYHEGPLDLKLYNSIGQIIYEERLAANNQHYIDIERFAKGNYMLRLFYEGNVVANEKVITLD